MIIVVEKATGYNDSVFLRKEILQTCFVGVKQRLEVRIMIILHGRYLTDRRSSFYLVVHVFATAHLTNLVLGVVLGGLAKRTGS